MPMDLSPRSDNWSKGFAPAINSYVDIPLKPVYLCDNDVISAR